MLTNFGLFSESIQNCKKNSLLLGNIICGCYGKYIRLTDGWSGLLSLSRIEAK